ncbi:hypothetical protein HK102_003802, partial [Quaeritorhiza haematococci]
MKFPASYVEVVWSGGEGHIKGLAPGFDANGTTTTTNLSSSVKFRVLLSSTAKISSLDARNAFKPSTANMTGGGSSSGGGAAGDRFGTGGGEGKMGGGGGGLTPFLMSWTFEDLMERGGRFMRVLEARLKYGVGWAGAEHITGDGLQPGTFLTASDPDANKLWEECLEADEEEMK